MRIIGTGNYNANVTTTTNSLANALLTRPEISLNVVNLFEDNFSAFSSFLSRRGMNKKGLFPGKEDSNFKVIGNRKYMWALRGYPFRKGVITTRPTAAAGYSNLGQNGSYFTLTLNTDFFSPNDTLELSDRRTILQIMDEYPVPTGTGEFQYKVKLVTNDADAFVPVALVDAGQEVGFSYTSFPELSETGYEKNTFPEWHTNYMTIQRMQFSISGSAQNSVLWIEHNGQKLWMFEQERAMMQRWAYARENQLLFGKATIDANDNVYLKDMKGRDLIQGDGLLAQGEGSLKFQYNTLTVSVLENVMRQMQLLSTGDGVTELFLLGGQKLVWDFQRLMRDVYKYNPIPLLVGGGNDKGVNSTFTTYQIGGVKITVAWHKPFDAQFRPNAKDNLGINKESYRGIFVNLGNTIGSDPMVELIALGNGQTDRTFVKKTITGMAEPGRSRGEFASNSMDGYQVQILSETGICLKNPFAVAELYKP